MALQVCQITPVSQAHGSNPETPRHSGHPSKESPTKFINFVRADGGGTFTFGTGVPDSEN